MSEKTSANIDPMTRSMGILTMDGAIIRAHPQTEDRTAIEFAPESHVGNIVREPDTGHWRYDEQLRTALGIKSNPSFATDYEAGKALSDHLPPLEQLNAFAKLLLSPRKGS